MKGLLADSKQKATHGTAATRDELVVSHLPLVKYLVDRTAATLPPHLDRDDLKSVASLGLIAAAERFDPSTGVQFRTFAEPCIRGALMDYLRNEDWLSRGLRGKVKRMEFEASLLEQRLGRSPSGEEIAVAMGLELKEYFQLLNETHMLSLVRLDDLWPDEDGAPIGLLDILEDKGCKNPQEQLIARQAIELLAREIDRLNKTERIVVTLYYYEELTLKEIASVLNLTESRISQIHAKTILRLRRKMNPTRPAAPFRGTYA